MGGVGWYKGGGGWGGVGWYKGGVGGMGGWDGWAGTREGVGWVVGCYKGGVKRLSSFNQGDGEKISSLNFENA